MFEYKLNDSIHIFLSILAFMIRPRRVEKQKMNQKRHNTRIWTCKHEFIGEVIEVGSKVKKVKVGDKVGVGGVVGACHSCEICNNDLEIYSPQMIITYSSFYHDETITYDSYPDTMVHGS